MNQSNPIKICFKGFIEAWEQRKLGDAINIGSGRDYKHLGEGNIPVYGTGGYLTSVDQALSSEKDAVGSFLNFFLKGNKRGAMLCL